MNLVSGLQAGDFFTSAKLGRDPSLTCCPALSADASAVGFAPTKDRALALGAAEHAPERTLASLNESGSQSPAKAVKPALGCTTPFLKKTTRTCQ